MALSAAGKLFIALGHLYTLLSNPIYTGPDRGTRVSSHPGQQPAVIDDESWSTVRDQLAANTSDHRRRAKSSRAEPAGGPAGRYSGGSGLNAITRRQEGPPLSLLRSPLRLITDAGGGSRARPGGLAARGDRGGGDQDPGPNALTSPGGTGRAVLVRPACPSDQNFAKLLSRAARVESSARVAHRWNEQSSFTSSSRRSSSMRRRSSSSLRRSFLLGIPSSASEAASEGAVELTAAVGLHAARVAEN